MIWLQTPPWARWLASCLIAAGAVWIELRPAPNVEHPFAIEDIAPGAVIDQANTTMKPVPPGTFTAVELGSIALRAITTGRPILSEDTGEQDELVPEGWWVIEVRMPRGAQPGDRARLVLLDSSQVVDGVVVAAAMDDPLGSGMGMIAVDAEAAAEAARAAAEGRVAVMVASG